MKKFYKTFYKTFSEHLGFMKYFLGVGSDISWGVIFRTDGALDSHLSTMDS